jgi:photosystem II stability/assembly factor-like uncharacterized protein
MGWGQSPPAANPAPAWENSGKPIVVPFLCTDDDIQWAGLSCSDDEPCPIYLELAAAASVGNRILTAGNIHSSAVTLYSVLLASEDAGHTWHEAHERIRGAGLDRVQFADPLTGWISGQLLFPLPQDPFLLLTSDGGASWRQRPIFGEGQYGSIQTFAFSSRTNGSLVIDRGRSSEGDRYALYDSPDGGETWAFKDESSKPMRLAREASESSDWRARADGATQSFHLERRLGERWSEVASFAVPLAPCRPPQAVDH